MRPVLYNKDETQFVNLGLGEIDALIAQVTRMRNDQYFLYMEYPANGQLVNQLTKGMLIKSDAGVRTKWQTFKITRILKDSNKPIKIWAVNKALQGLIDTPLKPFVAVNNGTATTALITLRSNMITDLHFDVWSDISTTTSTTWDISKVKNARQAIGGVEGSIIDMWGGELELDNNMIRLHQQMGRNTPTVLEYGRNIVNLEEDEQTDNVYTSIYPYASYMPNTDDGRDSVTETVTLANFLVDGKYYVEGTPRKVQVVDFSNQFDNENIPTQEKLETLAVAYANNNDVGAPNINATVKYIDLANTLGFEDFQQMEEVELCDIVPIYYPPLGVTLENNKVVTIIYDVLNDENISFDIGSGGRSLAGAVSNAVVGQITDAIQQSQNQIMPYIVNSRGNRIWHATPPDDIEHKIGDTWYDENGQYVIVKVWNGEYWDEKVNTEDPEKVRRELEQALNAAKEALEDEISWAENRAEEAYTKATDAESSAGRAESLAAEALDKFDNISAGDIIGLEDAIEAIELNDPSSTKWQEILQNENGHLVQYFATTETSILQSANAQTADQISDALAEYEFEVDLSGYATETWVSSQITQTTNSITETFNNILKDDDGTVINFAEFKRGYDKLTNTIGVEGESISELLQDSESFMTVVTNLTKTAVEGELDVEYETVDIEFYYVNFEGDTFGIYWTNGNAYHFETIENMNPYQTYQYRFDVASNWNTGQYYQLHWTPNGSTWSILTTGYMAVGQTTVSADFILTTPLPMGTEIRLKIFEYSRDVIDFKMFQIRTAQVPVLGEDTGAISSEIVQLYNSINMALFGENGALTRISMGESGVYIKGDYIYLDGEVHMNSAFVEELVAVNVSAVDINAVNATFAHLLAVNIDARDITTGRIDALEATLRAAYTHVYINGTAVWVNRNDGTRSVELNQNGVDVASGGTPTGRVGSAYDVSDLYTNGIMQLGAFRGGAVSLSSKKNGNGADWIRSLWVDGTNGLIKVGQPIMDSESGYGIEIRQQAISGEGTGIAIMSANQTSTGIAFVGGRVWYRTQGHGWRDFTAWIE